MILQPDNVASKTVSWLNFESGTVFPAMKPGQRPPCHTLQETRSRVLWPNAHYAVSTWKGMLFLRYSRARSGTTYYGVFPAFWSS